MQKTCPDPLVPNGVCNEDMWTGGEWTYAAPHICNKDCRVLLNRELKDTYKWTESNRAVFWSYNTCDEYCWDQKIDGTDTGLYCKSAARPALFRNPSQGWIKEYSCTGVFDNKKWSVAKQAEDVSCDTIFGGDKSVDDNWIICECYPPGQTRPTVTTTKAAATTEKVSTALATKTAAATTGNMHTTKAAVTTTKNVHTTKAAASTNKVTAPAKCKTTSASIAECGLALKTVKGIVVRKIVTIQQGVQLWHDRSYTITSFPAYMAGGSYATQAHKAIAKGSVISVTITGPSTLYVAVESGARNGGFQRSLSAAGWATQSGSVENNCCALNVIFSLKVCEATTVNLPATTTKETVMMVAAVPQCAGTTMEAATTTKNAMTAKITSSEEPNIDGKEKEFLNQGVMSSPFSITALLLFSINLT